MDLSSNLPLFYMIIALLSPFGIPLGATFVIIAAGSLSGTIGDYFFIISLIFSGLIIGDIAAYFTASHFEKIITKKLHNYEKIERKYKNGKDLFDKYGVWGIFLSRFVLLGFGAPLNYVSGFSKYSFRKFFAYSASGEFLYVSIYAYIGFVFKDSWVSLYDLIVEFPYLILLIFLAVFVYYQLKRYL
ncbi:MAG: VTT domain-containing protein [Candidatus Methanoperedens sp.]|nr:VTT domain-containing protein [Candidatus Methanoperedens sp.]MCE8429284.1 VTT domain-containing protein [Candidatus Methanoperedens sp.]